MSSVRNNTFAIAQTILAVVLFIIACYIYIVYRTDDMVLYSWLNINPHCNFFEALRTTRMSIPTWMRYNLPDALWLLSYLLIIDILWENWNGTKICFICIVPLFAYTIEFLQFANIASGTGDTLDLLSYTFALIVYWFIVKLKFITL